MVMADWINYLQNQGAELTDRHGTEIVSHFISEDEDKRANEDGSFIAPLTHLALINITGPDSAKFMQGQLTCDVNTVSPQLSALGAACSPKGRIYSSFRLIQRNDEETPQYLMRMRRDIVGTTLEALGKYIVFFKSEMADGGNDWVGIGVSGDACDTQLRDYFGKLPKEINQAVQSDRGLLIKVPGEDVRYELWVAAEHAQELWQKLAGQAQPAGTLNWILQDIRAGLAEVCQASMEEFIPQALNYQAVDAVSFNKGCYTGQEIVARTQYRGKAKRFMTRALLEGAPDLSTGMELLDADLGKSVATVVEAVPLDERQQEALLVILDDLADKEQWQLSINDREFSAQPLDLPYTLEQPNSE